MADPETMTVLLVEENPGLRAEISESLSHVGCSILEAADAGQAFATLHSCSVQVVVADVDMATQPNGLPFADELHVRWPNLGLVILSKLIRHLRPDQVPGAGIFVPRPVPPRLLVDLVQMAGRAVVSPKVKQSAVRHS
jgi:two-component system, response regulator PdtaR